MEPDAAILSDYDHHTQQDTLAKLEVAGEAKCSRGTNDNCTAGSMFVIAGGVIQSSAKCVCVCLIGIITNPVPRLAFFVNNNPLLHDSYPIRNLGVREAN